METFTEDESHFGENKNQENESPNFGLVKKPVASIETEHQIMAFYPSVKYPP